MKSHSTDINNTLFITGVQLLMLTMFLVYNNLPNQITKSVLLFFFLANSSITFSVDMLMLL